MKKIMLTVLFALLAMSVAMAQNFIPTTDTLGAHNDGGRGCAGCHAPHSGGRGAGGDVISGSGAAAAGAGVAEGDKALWGQDLYPITAQVLGFGDSGSFSVNFGGVQELTSTSSPLISGIAVCLSCHDGNVSEGAMMTGKSYEQAAGVLPIGGVSAYNSGNPLYGTADIPTLLGNDGGTAGDYSNDHPVGPSATITGVASAAGANLTYTLSSNGTGNSITWTTAGNYATFVSNYGMPAVASAVVDGTNRTPYVVCTTCHNQHIMNVYKSGSKASIAGYPSGSTFATYFFINGPYNPGAAWGPTAAPSTTQFCRQCHFNHSNEYYGVTTVTTAF
jgi:hypothetical protein